MHLFHKIKVTEFVLNDKNAPLLDADGVPVTEKYTEVRAEIVNEVSVDEQGGHSVNKVIVAHREEKERQIIPSRIKSREFTGYQEEAHEGNAHLFVRMLNEDGSEFDPLVGQAKGAAYEISISEQNVLPPFIVSKS